MPKDIEIDVSVVIGFKDWGLERLELSIISLNNAFGSLRGEVVISDFGSEDWEPIRDLANRHGAVYQRTPNAIGWSRSRAINAGYAQSRGRILVATDADMLFSPRSMELIVERIDRDPHLSVVLQCRDLPEGFSHENSDVISQNWKLLETVSQIRPRWGMGGMFAATRERVMNVGGYDNRMHTYGGEDLDFAQRIRRSGSPLLWIEDPEVRMYHIWHAPTISTVSQTAEGTEAVAFNRSILKNDYTWKRNNHLSEWDIGEATNSCSVLIHANNGPYLLDTINAIMNQINCRLDIIILTSKKSDMDNFRSISNFNRHSIKIIQNDSFQELIARGLSAAQAPFVTLISENTFLAPSSLDDNLKLFHGSTAATFALTLPLDSSQPEPKLIDDCWGTPLQVLANAFLVCRTDIARAVAPVGKNVGHWNAELTKSIILLDGELVSSDVLSVLSICDRIGQNRLDAEYSKISHDVFSLPSAVGEYASTTVDALMAELLPKEVYSRGVLLSAASGTVDASILSELPELVSWAMITDETASVIQFEAFIPNSSPTALDHFRSLGLSIEHLNSANIRQKQLLASIASRNPIDHAFRYVLSLDTLDRVRTVFAVIFSDDGEKMDLEHLPLVLNGETLFRTVNVDGMELSFLARECSTPESIAAARAWLDLVGSSLRNGIVAPGSLDVFAEIMKNEAVSA